MKEKHIILRATRVTTDDIFLGPRGMASASEAQSIRTAPLNLSIDLENIDRRNISALTRNRDVVAVAPSIPIRLITPLATEVEGQAVEGGITWGVKAVGADTSPFSGNGVIIAVLDTGIDASHAAFAGVDIVQEDFTGEGIGDTNGHGTHCAGTIFGRDTESTRIGVARGIKKALIGKVIGTNGGSSDMIVNAIQWAVRNGANVISMSLGMDFPGFQKLLQEEAGFPPELATSRALEGFRANVLLFERLASFIQIQGQEGFSQPTIIVAAAGNESRRNINPDFEIAVSPPAVSNGIISVAALGQGDEGLSVASFSNTFANVSAPGVDVVSAKAGGGLVSFNGTSMATPHVAGIAALWAEKIKSSGVFTPQNLTSRLIASAVTTGLQAGLDPFDIGAGLIQAPQS